MSGSRADLGGCWEGAEEAGQGEDEEMLDHFFSLAILLAPELPWGTPGLCRDTPGDTRRRGRAGQGAKFWKQGQRCVAPARSLDLALASGVERRAQSQPLSCQEPQISAGGAREGPLPGWLGWRRGIQSKPCHPRAGQQPSRRDGGRGPDCPWACWERDDRRAQAWLSQWAWGQGAATAPRCTGCGREPGRPQGGRREGEEKEEEAQGPRR